MFAKRAAILAAALFAVGCSSVLDCDWAEQNCRQECAKRPDATDCVRACQDARDRCEAR